jgi:hypothetical protein
MLMGWEYDLETDIRYLQGRAIAKKEKNILYTINLLTMTNLNNSEIASLVGVETKFVTNIKKSLSK